jgi:hypothetical protein
MKLSVASVIASQPIIARRAYIASVDRRIMAGLGRYADEVLLTAPTAAEQEGVHPETSAALRMLFALLGQA